MRGTGVRGFAKGRAFVVKDCGQRNPFEDIPPGSVLVAERLSLSDSTLIDFRNVVGIVTQEEDIDGQTLTPSSVSIFRTRHIFNAYSI